ncbi:unnamed protein product [Amoebophrya sp. A25]|nr:unnamed protein product [Amoebophrya sp. A25]|eukprot:GSA25T00023775001.1
MYENIAVVHLHLTAGRSGGRATPFFHFFLATFIPFFECSTSSRYGGERPRITENLNMSGCMSKVARPAMLAGCVGGGLVAAINNKHRSTTTMEISPNAEFLQESEYSDEAGGDVTVSRDAGGVTSMIERKKRQSMILGVIKDGTDPQEQEEEEQNPFTPAQSSSSDSEEARSDLESRKYGAVHKDERHILTRGQSFSFEESEEASVDRTEDAELVNSAEKIWKRLTNKKPPSEAITLAYLEEQIGLEKPEAADIISAMAPGELDRVTYEDFLTLWKEDKKFRDLFQEDEGPGDESSEFWDDSENFRAGSNEEEELRGNI